MATFRLPNVTGLSEKEQISQINRYLFQLVGELQFVTNSIESDINTIKTSLNPTGKVSSQASFESVVSKSGKDKSGSIKYASGLAIQWGDITITPSAENTPTSELVTFPIPFRNTPVVITTPVSAVPGTTVLGTSVSSVSATGFEAVLTRSNTTSTHIQWMAIGI